LFRAFGRTAHKGSPSRYEQTSAPPGNVEVNLPDLDLMLPHRMIQVHNRQFTGYLGRPTS
jgi:hypothetical protein